MKRHSPSLWNNLTHVTYSKHLSDSQVAERAGISRAQLNRIRNGRTIPRLDTALALACAFGCRVSDLFRITPATSATWRRARGDST